MNSKMTGYFVLLGIILIAFLSGLLYLFILGSESGVAQSSYSSFRADPLGTRAYYGALKSMPNISVQRNIKSILDIGEGDGKTLLICAADTSEDQEDTIEAVENFVAAGGRLIVTFYPLMRDPEAQLEQDEEDQEEEEKEDKDTGDSDDEAEEEKVKPPWAPKFVSIEERWGFSYGFSSLPRISDKEFRAEHAKRQIRTDALPSSLPWHSAMYFKDLSDNWLTLYAIDDRPVVMERSWRNGTIVLCSDSYLLSNEAMRNDRYPSFLAWLIGPSSKVIFEETHLGTQERPGIMTLAREYRLHGVLAALALMSLLFVWKNTFSLVPKHDEASAAGATAALGKDTTAGLVNLLRRSIPPGKLLAVCAKEWERSTPANGKMLASRKARIYEIIKREALMPRRQRDHVKAYQKICEIVAERD